MFSLRKSTPPLLLTFSLLSIYLATIAPGLSWANDGADGGDFVTAIATGGIPHPTGYPVYLLLAKLFQWLPVGSLAFRTNLLSALAAVLAVLMMYGILVWLPDSPVYGNWLAGMIAGYFLGLSPLLWSQAVITEVYTLHLAFVTLSIFLALSTPTFLSSLPLDRLRGLILGLSIGNHLTSVFLIPPVLFTAAWKTCRQFSWRSLFRISAWLGVGLLVYLILPIRALSNSPVNWGNPITVHQFVWLVTGELYQSRLADLTNSGIIERAQAWVTLLLQQFEPPGVTIALVGLVYFFKPSKLYFITIFNAIVFSLFSIFYASFDSYVYLIPVFLSFAIWIGLGVGRVLQSMSRHTRGAQAVTILLFSFLFFALIISRWTNVDAKNDLRAEQFGSHIMKITPRNAIVFVEGDRAIFALWYFHFALKQRPDIAILATDLLQANWYVEILRSTYPLINLSGDFFWPETVEAQNPGRAICYVSYWDSENISCNIALLSDE